MATIKMNRGRKDDDNKDGPLYIAQEAQMFQRTRI